MAAREVPVRTKMLYGIGDAAINIKNSAVNQFLLFFYADVLLAAPELIGIAIFVGKLWDAVTDPVMGYLSDSTRSGWGRRRPYVLAGAAPMGLCFYLLFAPPALSPHALVLYLGVVGIALYTCFTVFATPYMAWGAELCRDYHERTEVVQIRAVFGVIGGVIGATAPVLIAQRYLDARAGYATMALALGVAIAVTGLLPALLVRDTPRPNAVNVGFSHFLKGLRSTFANRDFAIVFITFCLMTVATAGGQAVQLIVVKYRLQMLDFYPTIALVFAISFTASFPLWLTISRRIGKQRALMAALMLGCVTPFGWLIVQPGQRGFMLVFMVVAGILTGSITLAISQAADVIDLDELATGEQRAGAYFGIWTLGLKTSGAFGVLLGGFLLRAVGYVADQPQSSETMQWLVFVLGPFQAFVHFCGLMIFRRINIGETDIAQVQAALRARKQE